MITAFIAAVLTIASAQQAWQRYTDGQEIKICGDVLYTRVDPSSCRAVLRVSSAGEEFAVLIPVALQKQLAIEPMRLTGALACFTGQASVLPTSVRITAAAAEMLALPPEPAFGEGAVLCGEALMPPQVLKGQRPQYTSNAMRARIQGHAKVQAVVDTNGSVSAVRILQPLHAELDEQALSAVREWKFAPATLNGKPVPAVVEIETTFKMPDRNR